MGVKIKFFNIMGVHWKIWFLAGRGYENSIYRGNCLKNELGQLADLRGGGGGGGGGAWQKNPSWSPSGSNLNNTVTKIWWVSLANLLLISANSQRTMEASLKDYALWTCPSPQLGFKWQPCYSNVTPLVILPRCTYLLS